MFSIIKPTAPDPARRTSKPASGKCSLAMPTDPPHPSAKSQTCVMLVDDDAVFLSVLADNLVEAGYAVLRVNDPRQALEQVKQGVRPDACIFDWNMPGLDGLALFRQLRALGITVPVVFLTSYSQPLFEETALDAGAADFVDKTRGPAIIRQRLSLALRRGETTGTALDGQGTGDIQIGELALARASKRASWRGCFVPLSPTEFDVLVLLAEKAGRDVGYRQIYDVVHCPGFVAGQGDNGYRANVRAMVKRIRRKFVQLDPDFAVLQNYPGFGYRWSQIG